MKRFIALTVAILITLNFVACAEKESDNENNSEIISKTTTTAETTTITTTTTVTTTVATTTKKPETQKPVLTTTEQYQKFYVHEVISKKRRDTVQDSERYENPAVIIAKGLKMVIQSKKSKEYCRIVISMMDRYSKNTVMKAVDLLNSESLREKIYQLVDENLSEDIFLMKLEKFKIKT